MHLKAMSLKQQEMEESLFQFMNTGNYFDWANKNSLGVFIFYKTKTEKTQRISNNKQKSAIK